MIHVCEQMRSKKEKGLWKPLPERHPGIAAKRAKPPALSVPLSIPAGSRIIAKNEGGAEHQTDTGTSVVSDGMSGGRRDPRPVSSDGSMSPFGSEWSRPGSALRNGSGTAPTEAEGRLRRVLDSVLAFVGTLSPDGILTEANAPAIEASGLGRDDLVGLPFPDCFWWSHSPELQARVWDAIARARAGEVVRFDAEIRVKGDRRIWIDFQLAPNRDETGRVIELIPSGVDITARKQGEMELRRNEERLRFALDAGALGDWDYDVATGFARRSARHDEIFGYREPRKDWTLESFLSHVASDDRDRVRASFSDALATGGDWDIVCRIVRADGSDGWIRAQGKPRTDASGAVTHLVGIVADVTESRRAEAALTVKDERLRLALDVGQVGIWDWDIHKNRSEWSDTHFSLLGYEIGSIPAGFDAWRVRVHPDDVEEIDRRIARAVERGEDVSTTYRLRHPDGRIVHVNTRIHVLSDGTGKPARMIGVMADVTDLTEANLRADMSERRLEKVFANAPVGLAYHDRDLGFRAVNARLAGFVGKPLDDFIGKTPHEIDPAFGAIFKPVLDDAMETSEPTHDVEVRMSRPRGGEAIYLVNCDVDRDVDGAVTGINVAVQDITELTAAERQRRALLRELAHRVSNSLNVIQSIARQTLIGSPDPSEFARSIIGRINSLAATHAILMRAEWSGADLRRVLQAQLDPVAPATLARITLEGPDVPVPPELASNIGLIIHELGVNALRFGALSVPEGRIAVTWSVVRDMLELEWVERGGPPISEPPRSIGFGTRLGQMAGGRVERTYDPDGLTFRLAVRLDDPGPPSIG